MHVRASSMVLQTHNKLSSSALHPHSPVEDSRDAKVTQLDDARLRQEYVLRLDVSVEDFPVVDVLETQTDLNKPV